MHLVELDLLIQGNRPPLDAPLPAGDYYYLVTRSDRRPDCNVNSWTMADRLPTVPVPLHLPDADILCDLGAVFATAYERGRYRRAINYRKAPALKLSPCKRWVLQQARRDKPGGS